MRCSLTVHPTAVRAGLAMAARPHAPGVTNTSTQIVDSAGGGCNMEQFGAIKCTKDGQPVRYLVVDDSVFARKNLARMIETFGGQVVGEAGDGMTAITEYDRTTPAIVLMDITMPQMEGI